MTNTTSTQGKEEPMVQLFGIVRFDGNFAMVIHHNEDDNNFDLLHTTGAIIPMVSPNRFQVWSAREVQNEISSYTISRLAAALAAQANR